MIKLNYTELVMSCHTEKNIQKLDTRKSFRYYLNKAKAGVFVSAKMDD